MNPKDKDPPIRDYQQADQDEGENRQENYFQNQDKLKNVALTFVFYWVLNKKSFSVTMLT